MVDFHIEPTSKCTLECPLCDRTWFYEKFKKRKLHEINVDNIDKSDSSKEKELKSKLEKEKDTDTLEAQVITLKGQLALIKQKLENERNKAIKPEPNPLTGEVPLRTGIAAALLDKNAKNKVKDVLDRVKQKKEIKVGEPPTIIIQKGAAK
jgi:hypothetical protein